MGLPERKLDAPRTVFKAIKLRKQQPAIAEQISNQFKLSSVAGRVLAARGYRPDDDLRHYISPTLKEGLPDPNALRGLKQACQLVKAIVDAGGAIAICCDFDVDGLSGGAQVYHFLRSIGVSAKVFVPDRFEDGYGLNEKMIQAIAEEKFALIITIDYGTTNLRELTLAAKLGLKTIVIDHHHVGSAKPPCDVFINPNQQGCGFAKKILSASGLAWYLVLGLRQIFESAHHIEARKYLDLACLGTICDMVPLIGANRVLAKRGLEILSSSTRPGIVALRNAIGIQKQATCFDVSFGIGPRINAAGRMVNGSMVIDLLTTDDSIQAEKLAKKLNAWNLDRQATEQQVKETAIRLVEARGELPQALVVWDARFHTGVIGIVAQRLVEAYYRPAVVLGADKDGIYKGSVRGVKGFSVVETLASVSEHLIKFGGHEGAGGLSVHEDNLEAFEIAFIRACEERLAGLATQPYAEADTEATVADVTVPLVEELKQFAPFGIGNPSPMLLLKKLKVTDLKVLKDAHLKVILNDGQRSVTGLMWRNRSHPALSVGSIVNVVCKPDVNSYNGSISIQVTIEAAELV